MNFDDQGQPEVIGFGAPPIFLDPRITKLYAYWSSKAGPSGLPIRSQMDPLTEIPGLLPYLWLLDLEGPEKRARYRLIGTEVAAPGILPRVGDYLDDLSPPDDALANFDVMKNSCLNNQPAWRRGAPTWHHDSSPAQIDTMMLPIATRDADRPSQLLNITIYRWHVVGIGSPDTGVDHPDRGSDPETQFAPIVIADADMTTWTGFHLSAAETTPSFQHASQPGSGL